MNVYVVSSVWADGATVIGAAVDRESAEQIADRAGRAGEWTPWQERIDPAQRSFMWGRMALLMNGSVHPSLSQEIVVVPLAGMVETGELPAVLRSSVREWAAAQPVEIVTSAPERVSAVPIKTTLGEAVGLVAAARRKTREMNLDAPDVRIGAGAGHDYFRRVAGSVADLRASPASILGLPIVVDAAMHPDDIRIGSVTYTIGTGVNGIPAGTMIRVDRDALNAYLSDVVDRAFARFTTPPD